MRESIKGKRIAPLVLLCTLLSFTNPYIAQNSEPIRIYTDNQLLLDRYLSTSALPVEISERANDAHLILESKFNAMTGKSYLLMTVQDTQFTLPQSPVLQTHDYTASGTFLIDDTTVESIRTYLEGVLDYIAGDCEAMQETFDSLDTTDASMSYHIAIYQGHCALLSDDYETAQAHYETVSDSDLFLTSSAIVNQAWIDLQSTELESAFARLDVHVEAMSTRQTRLPFGGAQALATRAQFHALNFDYDSALVDMNEAIDRLPLDAPDEDAHLIAELLTLRGRLTLLIYEWNDVLADYDRAIDIAPEYAPAYYWRALLFYTQGPREQALQDFESYIALAPDGEFAKEAQTYADDIRTELDALDG